MEKIIRTSTIPLSLNILLKGQLEYLNQHYKLIAVSGEGDDLTEVKIRENVEVYAIEMQRSISPFKDLISLIALVLYFKKTKPLIVHSITPKAGLLSMLAAKFAKVPIRIHMFTGLIFPSKTGLMQKLLIKMDQLLCWAATDIYPEGQGVKDDLMHYNITKKPLNIIANGNVNGINTSYFNPSLYNDDNRDQLRNKLSLKAEDFVFIFVGRLVGDKGINELVAAFKDLKGEYLRLEDRKIRIPKLLLVGNFEKNLDPLSPKTLLEIENNPNIISVGYQSDVRPYFAISDALVFPSYREGFPNVVMQAGAMDLPSIVSDINGCNEIIIQGKNGLIVPPKSTNALLMNMKQFLSDKELLKRLKANARRMIVDRYEQEVVWKAILAEYKRLEENLTKRENV